MSLVLSLIVGLSQACEAGIITSASDLGGTNSVLTAADIPLADSQNPRPQLTRSSLQDYGMNSARGGSDVNSLHVVLICQEMVQPKLVRWLVAQSRLVSPDSITIGLLKVPIEVVSTEPVI